MKLLCQATGRGNDTGFITWLIVLWCKDALRVTATSLADLLIS